VGSAVHLNALSPLDRNSITTVVRPQFRPNSKINEITEGLTFRQPNRKPTTPEQSQALFVRGIHLGLQESQRFDLKRSKFALAVKRLCAIETEPIYQVVLTVSTRRESTGFKKI